MPTGLSILGGRGWGVYLMIDDIEATAAAAPEHGGRVDLAPMQVAENGHMAMLSDPGRPPSASGSPARSEASR